MNQSYTGATTISAGGTLQLGNGTLGGALLTASSILDNGVLAFANSGTTVQGVQFTAGDLSGGSGGLTQFGPGTLVLEPGEHLQRPDEDHWAGAIQLANPNALQNSYVTVSASNGLTFAASGQTYNLAGLARGQFLPERLRAATL